MPSMSHEELLCEHGDMDWRTEEVARESILVEEHGAMVLGDHVEVLRQGTVATTPYHAHVCEHPDIVSTPVP